METTLSVPKELFARYARLAQRAGKSTDAYIREVLENAIDQREHDEDLFDQVAEWKAGRLETSTLTEVRERYNL